MGWRGGNAPWLNQPTGLRAGQGRAGLGGTGDQTQASSRLGGPLQPVVDAFIPELAPAPGGPDARSAQGLLERPEPLSPAAGADHHRPRQVEPQPREGGGIQLVLNIDQQQWPGDSQCQPQGQPGSATSRADRDEFEQPSDRQLTSRQKLPQGAQLCGSEPGSEDPRPGHQRPGRQRLGRQGRRHQRRPCRRRCRAIRRPGDRCLWGGKILRGRAPVAGMAAACQPVCRLHLVNRTGQLLDQFPPVDQLSPGGGIPKDFRRDWFPAVRFPPVESLLARSLLARSLGGGRLVRGDVIQRGSHGTARRDRSASGGWCCVWGLMEDHRKTAARPGLGWHLPPAVVLQRRTAAERMLGGQATLLIGQGGCKWPVL